MKLSRMVNQTSSLGFSKQFSICTLVTSREQYELMLNSAMAKGFDTESCEYLHADNCTDNTIDANEAINVFLKQAVGRYVIVCHQDIEFNFDDINVLLRQIRDLEEQDPNWGIIGNAGIAENLKPHLHISEPHGEAIQLANANAKMSTMSVGALDENFMVFNNKFNLSASRQLQGFHLYGLDVCQNAIHLGHKCYAVDFHLLHKSSGNKNSAFFENKRQMKALMRGRKKSQLIKTTSTQFYSSASSLIEKLLNSKLIIKLLIKAKQRTISL